MTSRIYTRTGDDGTTGLFGGGRLGKDDARVMAYGEVDELNSCIGLARSTAGDRVMLDRLSLIQEDLFAIGAHLATRPVEGRAKPASLPELPNGRIVAMEGWIDGMVSELPEQRHFILPGGGATAAALHLARTVCRRAERAVVALGRTDSVEAGILEYLNRLSDLLFVMARFANQSEGIADTPWIANR